MLRAAVWIGAVVVASLGCGGETQWETVPVVASAGTGAGGGKPLPMGGAGVASGGGGIAEPIPDPDWTTASPETEGVDGAGLQTAASVASADGSYCLLVIRHGVLIGEWYWGGHDATTAEKSWSIAKTYASVLVGIAVDRGDIGSLDDSVAKYVSEWQGTDREPITIRNLVSMTSGLAWSAFQDYVAMATLTQDQTAFALGLAAADPPANKWTYNNGAVQVLEAVFRNATGRTIEQYAEEHLWSRIGMHASWAHDGAGHPTAYANVLASCRDHARLGYLALHGGRWSDETIVPGTYFAAALQPSQPFNRAYGLLWWLNAETPALDAMMVPWPGRMVPFAPPDLFAARGFGNQFVDVLPSLDLIVVRFGSDPYDAFDLAELAADSRFTKHDAILKPILDAVVGP